MQCIRIRFHTAYQWYTRIHLYTSTTKVVSESYVQIHDTECLKKKNSAVILIMLFAYTSKYIGYHIVYHSNESILLSTNTIITTVKYYYEQYGTTVLLYL